MSAKRERRHRGLCAAFPLAGRWLPSAVEQTVLSWLAPVDFCSVAGVHRGCRKLVAAHLGRLQQLELDRGQRQPSRELLCLLLQDCRSLKSVRLAVDPSVYRIPTLQLAKLVQHNAASLERLELSGVFGSGQSEFATLVAGLALCPRLQTLDTWALCDVPPEGRNDESWWGGSAMMPIDAEPALSALELALTTCTDLRDVSLPFLTMPATARMLRKMLQLTKLAHLAVPLCPVHCSATWRGYALFAHPNLAGLRSLRLELYKLSQDYAGALNALAVELPALETLVLVLDMDGDATVGAALLPWSLPRLVALTVSCDGRQLSSLAVPQLPVIAAPRLEVLRTSGLYREALLCCLTARSAPGLSTVEMDVSREHSGWSRVVGQQVASEWGWAIEQGHFAALRCCRACVWLPPALWRALANDCAQLEELEGWVDDAGADGAANRAPGLVRRLLAGCPRLTGLTMRARVTATEADEREDDKKELLAHNLERLALRSVSLEGLMHSTLPRLRELTLRFPDEVPLHGWLARIAAVRGWQGWLGQMSTLSALCVSTRKERLRAELAGRPREAESRVALDALWARIRRLSLVVDWRDGTTRPGEQTEAKAQTALATPRLPPLLEYVYTQPLIHLEELEMEWMMGCSRQFDAAVLRCLAECKCFPALHTVRLPQRSEEKRAKDREELQRCKDVQEMLRQLRQSPAELESTPAALEAGGSDCRALVLYEAPSVLARRVGVWRNTEDPESSYARRLLNELSAQLADRIRSGQLELYFGQTRAEQLFAV